MSHPKTKSYSDCKYEEWIKQKACLICNKLPVHGHHAFHARNNSYTLIPLCERHHMPGYPASYHSMELEKFENFHGVDVCYEIINLLAEYIHEREKR